MIPLLLENSREKSAHIAGVAPLRRSCSYARRLPWYCSGTEASATEIGRRGVLERGASWRSEEKAWLEVASVDGTLDPSIVWKQVRRGLCLGSERTYVFL